MPTSRAPAASTRGKFSGSYNSTSGVMPKRDDVVVQPAELCVVETLGDQQHGVGPGDSRLQDLVGIEDEILAQQRQIDGRADLAQIVETALEMRPVGQHADAGGPVLLVDLGDLDGVEVGAEDAPRGAGLLHFGDEADGAAAGQGGVEIANRRGVGQLPSQLVLGDVGSGRGDFTPLLGNDLVKEGGHRRIRERMKDQG